MIVSAVKGGRLNEIAVTKSGNDSDDGYWNFLSSRQPLHDFIELIEIAVFDMHRAALHRHDDPR